MAEKIVLISGTRKGIGAALAKHFLKLGNKVIGCSREMPSWSNEFANYEHFIADIGNEKAVKNMFKSIAKTYQKLDVLINNAGIASMNHSLLTPMDAAQRVFNTNALGTFLLCREAAKLMRKKNFGRIVNFATVAIPLKIEGEAIYAASKSAIVSLTQILAREFADFGITVNAVGPTPIQTDLIRNVPQEKINSLLERQAIHRYGTYEDVENVIDFFLKDESNFVTGQVIYLGGC